MMICTNCQTNITENYCPNCGQKFIAKKLSVKSILVDYTDAFFSVDSSILNNFKLLLFNPGFIIKNYWNGFRNYYLSPNKILIISTLFLGLNFILSGNTFLGIKISAVNFSAQLGFVVFLIPLLTISSYLGYIPYKRNLIEHLVLNIYNLSFWLILFSLVSVAVSLFNLTEFRYYLFFSFLILIFIWNSRVFTGRLFKNITGILINAITFAVILGSIIYFAIKLGSN